MIRIMMYDDGHDQWRAACYVAADGQGELCLTGPEHAHLDADALLAVGESQWADVQPTRGTL